MPFSVYGARVADALIPQHFPADAEVIGVVSLRPCPFFRQERGIGHDDLRVRRRDILGEFCPANGLQMFAGNRRHIVGDAALEEQAKRMKSAVGQSVLVGFVGELLVSHVSAVGESHSPYPLVCQVGIKLAGVPRDVLEPQGLRVFDALVNRTAPDRRWG